MKNLRLWCLRFFSLFPPHLYQVDFSLRCSCTPWSVGGRSQDDLQPSLMRRSSEVFTMQPAHMVKSCSLHSGGWGSVLVFLFGLFWAFLGLNVGSFINILYCVFLFPNSHVYKIFFNIWGKVTFLVLLALPLSFFSVKERRPEVNRETIVSHCPLTAERLTRPKGKLWPCTAYAVRDEKQLLFFLCNIFTWGEYFGIRISAFILQGCLQNKSDRGKFTQWCFPEQGDSPKAWNSTWQTRVTLAREFIQVNI